MDEVDKEEAAEEDEEEEGRGESTRVPSLIALTAAMVDSLPRSVLSSDCNTRREAVKKVEGDKVIGCDLTT